MCEHADLEHENNRRREFLTGFHKRKQERLKHAHAHMEKKYLTAKKEFRQAVSAGYVLCII